MGIGHHKIPISKLYAGTALWKVVYYHILADSIVEAIEIAKQNPEFAFVATASIEIRPVKTKEGQTNFVYPK